MLKILYLINHAGKAGTETYVISMMRKLPAIDPGVSTALCHNEPGPLADWARELGAPVFRLKMRNPFDIVAAAKLAGICRREKIDIVHAQFLRENYIAMLSRIFRPRTRVFYTNHFILPNGRALRFFNRIMTRLQTQVVAVCNPGREMMIRNGNDGRKIEVIFNGVDPAFWGERRPSTLRSELGIPDGQTVLFCGSRFAHDKGHRFLIDAMALIAAEAPGKFVLVLSSDGPLLETVKAQAASLSLGDAVRFIGPRKDMKNVYDGSDIYINASEHEALSFAIIEALAEGLPVIATDMGGNGDIINSETDCGMLVEYDNPRSLADAVLKLAGDPALREKYRRNAAAAVSDKFNLDKMVLRTYNLYVKATEKGV